VITLTATSDCCIAVTPHSLENPKNLYNGQGLGDDQRAGSRLSFSSNRSFEDVLFELKSWKDKGLIDEDEYKTHKAEVLTVAGSR
jgi:hypothetical protein